MMLWLLWITLLTRVRMNKYDLNCFLIESNIIGPLAASVAASDWGFYSGGVFDGCDYDSNIAVNHAVLLMGYGTDDDGQDYWLIQNSWGEHWGDVAGGNPGFIKLRRQETTQCGEDTTPLDGSGCEDGGVESVHVCGTCAVVSDNSYPIGATYVK